MAHGTFRTADRALARSMARHRRERADRLWNARHNWAGVRQVNYNRQTGTLVAVLDGEAAGLDTDGGRWSTLCDDHSHVVAHLTLADARAHAAAPLGWCEPCMKAGA